MWTDERLAQAKEMYSAGAPASKIAVELGGGLTRNAVCGQIARGNWKRKPGTPVSPHGLRGTVTAPKRFRTPFRPLPQPRNHDEAPDLDAALVLAAPKRRTPLTASPVTDIVAARPTVTRMTNHGNRFDVVEVDEPRSIMELPPDDSPCAVTLFDLGPRHCRWPITRDGAPMMYCGADQITEINSSYCGRHSRLAFQPASARKISDAERERRRDLGRDQAASGAWK